MVNRLKDVVAAQDAAAVEKAWADDKVYHNPDTGRIVRKLFGGLNNAQAAAGRTRPLIHTRPHRRWLRRGGNDVE